MATAELRHCGLLICDDVLPGGAGTDLIVACRNNLGQPLFPAVLLQTGASSMSLELLEEVTV